MSLANNSIIQSPRFAGAVALLGVVAVGAAVLMQYLLDLTPCPLCILQRYCLLAMTLFCLISCCTKGRLQTSMLALAGAAALTGIAFAARQVYLQATPQISAGCGPGFEYIVNSFPLTEMLPLLFKGTGDCAQVDWIWHGITVPKLSLVTFVGFAGLFGLRLWPAKR